MGGGPVLTAILTALLGSGGMLGLFVWYIKRYIEKKLINAERTAEERRQMRIREAEIEDELHHAYGRMFFWLYKASITGSSNGELKKAFEELEYAETKRKEHLRQITANAKTE